MAFVEKNGLKYFRFENFPKIAQHAIFTRRGGVSTEHLSSLNVGGSVGDTPANIRTNRIRAFAALGRDPASVFDVWQVHGKRAVFALQPRNPNAHNDKADIIFTDRPEITLYMRFADCTPLIFVDLRQGVVGLAHAGWQGTVLGVAAAAVAAMQAHFNSSPADLYAAIGPAIGVDHYEVGEDVVTAVHKAFGTEAERLLPLIDGRRHFDLKAANRLQLEKAGVQNIESADICTACHLEDWFSHRAENGKTGRFAVLLGLRS